MGLISINQVSSDPRKASTLEQIAAGVEIAANILGVGMKGYETFGPKGKADARESEARARYYDAQSLTKPFDEETKRQNNKLDHMLKTQEVKNKGLQGQILGAKIAKGDTPALPQHEQRFVNDTTIANSKKLRIANSLEAGLQKGKDPKLSQDAKIKVYEGMLKTLNSPEGADAIGKEEANRLGGLLQYKLFNIMNPGSFMGRDIDLFEEQVKSNVDILRDATKLNQKMVEDKFREYGVNPKAIGGPGSATNLNEMSDDQLDEMLRKISE